MIHLHTIEIIGAVLLWETGLTLSAIKVYRRMRDMKKLVPKDDMFAPVKKHTDLADCEHCGTKYNPSAGWASYNFHPVGGPAYIPASAVVNRAYYAYDYMDPRMAAQLRAAQAAFVRGDHLGAFDTGAGSRKLLTNKDIIEKESGDDFAPEI